MLQYLITSSIKFAIYFALLNIMFAGFPNTIRAFETFVPTVNYYYTWILKGNGWQMFAPPVWTAIVAFFAAFLMRI